MEKVTLEEIKSLKTKLDDSIANLLYDFTKATGTYVSKVKLYSGDDGLGYNYMATTVVKIP